MIMENVRQSMITAEPGMPLKVFACHAIKDMI